MAADYYRYLAEAICALPSDTPEARAELYERIRIAVLRRLRARIPPAADAEIAAHQSALASAIRLVELSASYRPMLSRAVAGLAQNTQETRASLYRRGRASLEQRLRTAQQPRSEADIGTHLAALDEAIRAIEAEHAVPVAVDRFSAPQEQPVRRIGPMEGEPAPAARTRFRLPAGLMLLVLAGLTVASMWLADKEAEFPTLKPAADIAAWTMLLLLLGYFVYVVVCRRRNLREAGLRRRYVTAFAAGLGKSEARRQNRLRLYQQAADALDDDGLLWAWWLPDHCEDAKVFILGELERRGHSASSVRQWSPPASQLAVPPTVDRPLTAGTYRRLSMIRRVALIVFRVIALASVALVALALFDHDNIDPALGITGVAAMIGLLLLLLAAVLAFVVQDRARRILLLRPFGEKKMTSALKRFVRKSLGPAGYAFTLSDRNYKPSFVDSMVFRIVSGTFETLVQLAVGSVFANSHRLSAVKSDKTFFRLARALTQKYTLSYWSFITSGQAFNIRTTDSFWQLCVQMLMHSCDVVIVDLSLVKEGTAWEINELARRDLRAKCIFVVSENRKAALDEVMARHFSREARPHVHIYKGNGSLIDERQFDAAFKERIVAVGV